MPISMVFHFFDWITGDMGAPALSLLLRDVVENGVQIVMESTWMSIAHSTDFIDNGIVPGVVFKSSSGVQ